MLDNHNLQALDHSHEHFQQLRHWLSLEAEAETARIDERRRQGTKANAEKSGETLLDLVIINHEPGLGGRTRLTLVKRNRTLQLHWNRLRVGSTVVLAPNDGEGDSQNGVLSARRRDSIEVSVTHWPESEHLRLDLSADEITRKRQARALQTVE